MSKEMAALHQLCRRAVVELGALGACVAVEGSAGPEVLASSDEAASALEDLQFVLGEGPTGDAFREARPVLAPDLAVDTRWLQFAATARSHGVGAVYAWPLQFGAVRSGVLTVYRGTGEPLDDVGLRECAELADTIRDHLLGAVDGVVNGANGLSGSLPLRTVVYQAQGMVMVALGISLAEALVRLRALAFAEELDLNVLASQLVSGRRPMLTLDQGAQ